MVHVFNSLSTVRTANETKPELQRGKIDVEGRVKLIPTNFSLWDNSILPLSDEDHFSAVVQSIFSLSTVIEEGEEQLEGVF